MSAPTPQIDQSVPTYVGGEPTLTVACQGGLCNRLRVLVSGLTLAEASGRRFTMWWPRSSACAATFSELFENDNWNVREVPVDRVTALPHQGGTLANRMPDFLTAPDRDIVVRTPAWLVQPGHYPDHEPLMSRAVELFRQLRPAAPIRESVDRFRRRYFRTKMIGVHLRRGDFHRHLPQCVDNTRGAMARVDAYLGEAPDAGVLLCSDDGANNRIEGGVARKENVRAAFTARYGERVVTTTPRSLDRACPEAIQDALADLLLLRSTDYFVGTRSSTFSDMSTLGRTVPSAMVTSDSLQYRATEFLMRATCVDRAIKQLGRVRFGKSIGHWAMIRYYEKHPRNLPGDATVLLTREIPRQLIQRLRPSKPR